MELLIFLSSLYYRAIKVFENITFLYYPRYRISLAGARTSVWILADGAMFFLFFFYRMVSFWSVLSWLTLWLHLLYINKLS